MTSLDSSSNLKSESLTVEAATSKEVNKKSTEPSYISLSCTVSGYGEYNKYSPSNGNRINPSQIPVRCEPQTLDSVGLVLQQELEMRDMTLKGHDCTDRGYFPTSEKESSGGTNKNLVQKQIERLYGNSAKTVNGSSQLKTGKGSEEAEAERETRGQTGSGALDFQPLKVPAVFRLLRPEFRDQLKSNSSKVPNDQSTPLLKKGARLFDIKVTAGANIEEIPPKERFIPIQNLKLESPTDVSVKYETSNLPLVTSPGLVSKVESEKPERREEGLEKEHVPFENVLSEDKETEEQETDFNFGQERALLCTIIEEDNESSTSGSQINLSRTVGQSVMKKTLPGSQGPAVLQEEEEIHDGHYFIKLLENEIFKFEEAICDFEEDLNVELSENIREAIFTTIGKAKLLMAQKLSQFRGLCDKNITLTVEQDPFVPTSQDLAGFWDMVYIQIEHIHMLFSDLHKLKMKDWKNDEGNGVSMANLSSSSISSIVNTPSPAGKFSDKTKKSSRAKNISTENSKKKHTTSKAAKARDEARKKMIEEKKRKMKELGFKNNDGDVNFVQF